MTFDVHRCACYRCLSGSYLWHTWRVTYKTKIKTCIQAVAVSISAFARARLSGSDTQDKARYATTLELQSNAIFDTQSYV